MSWGRGSFKARKNSALKLPLPQGHTGSLKVTVPEDEIRMAIIGRVAA